MIIALVGTLLLAVLVFAFVLEPLLRARPDEIVIESVALPDVVTADEEVDGAPEEVDAIEPKVVEERGSSARVVDRAVGSDAT